MANPALVRLDDGDFISSPFPCAPHRIELAFPFSNNAKIVKQQWCVRADQQAPGNPLQAGPVVFGQPTYLVDETEPTVDIWQMAYYDRVWATLPGNRVEFSAGTKVMKELHPVYQNGNLILDPLATWTDSVVERHDFSYYLGATAALQGNIPGVPDVIFINLGPLGTFVVGVNGFVVTNGAGNNFGFTFARANIRRWMGDIYERELVFSLQ
jgi:hypothetical protein